MWNLSVTLSLLAALFLPSASWKINRNSAPNLQFLSQRSPQLLCCDCVLFSTVAHWCKAAGVSKLLVPCWGHAGFPSCCAMEEFLTIEIFRSSFTRLAEFPWDVLQYLSNLDNSFGTGAAQCSHLLTATPVCTWLWSPRLLQPSCVCFGVKYSSSRGCEAPVFCPDGEGRLEGTQQ